MMNLYCLERFRQGDFNVLAGETISVPTVVGEWLLSSFPAHWQVAESAPVDPAPTDDGSITEEPPADKAVRRAPKVK